MTIEKSLKPLETSLEEMVLAYGKTLPEKDFSFSDLIGHIKYVGHLVNLVKDDLSNTSLPIHICSSEEYDPETKKPTVSDPEPNVFYMVPTGDTEGDDLFRTWSYMDGRWELFESMTIDIPQSDWAQTDVTALDYIKNKPTIPEASPQPDWAQSDSTAADYIKNRDKAPKVDAKEYYLEEITVNLEGKNGDMHYHYIIDASQFIPVGRQLVVGELYNVKIDDTVFKDIPAVSTQGGRGIALGAQSPGDSTNFVTYGFGIALSNNNPSGVYMLQSFVFSDGGDHSFSIYQGNLEYKYQPDWNNNDESSAQHIINRPGGYLEDSMVDKVNVSDLAFQTKHKDGVYMLSNPSIFVDLTIGNAYDVLINGIRHKDCVVTLNGSSVYLGGNPSGDYSDVVDKGFSMVLNRNSETTVGSIAAVFIASNEPVTTDMVIQEKSQSMKKIPRAMLDVDEQMQPDWAQTDTTAMDYIKNKPDVVSYASNGSFAAGMNATASASDSFASGKSNATAMCSVAEGCISGIVGLKYEGDYIFNFGDSKAAGKYSHAEGQQTASIGEASHAGGVCSIAYGKYSHAIGYCTVATGANQHVFGEFNAIDGTVDEHGNYTGTQNSSNRSTYVEIVGNGKFKQYGDGNTHDGYANRTNARTLDWSGNEWLAGNLTAAGGSITIGSTTITEAQLQALLATLS